MALLMLNGRPFMCRVGTTYYLLRCELFLSRIPDSEWFQVLDLVTSHKGWALGALPHMVTTWNRRETASGIWVQLFLEITLNGTPFPWSETLTFDQCLSAVQN